MDRYLLQWRRMTPAGKPASVTKTKNAVEQETDLTMDDLQAKLTELLPVAGWIYVERTEVAVSINGTEAHTAAWRTKKEKAKR